MGDEIRGHILSEIQRLARASDGVPPGQNVFTRITGISTAKWRGVHWLKWSEALAEAGFAPNEWTQRRESDEILRSVAELARRVGRLPTGAELKMERRRNDTFPAHSTVDNHFRTKADLNAALLRLADEDDQWADLNTILSPIAKAEKVATEVAREGLVYLMQSGSYYKVGRSDDIERRFRQVSVALPDKVTLVHTIRTDDPVGIESYWHRRFADSRANGEWFELSGADVRAFCRRTFQ